jgi:deoxyribodipyrimidine photo-lyase
MERIFDTAYSEILKKMDSINPIQYGKTRNYIDGAVTYLSPYISRGVISTKKVLEKTIERGYTLDAIQPFVKELCWRDYFQRVGQEKNLHRDIKNPQEQVIHHQIPSAIVSASTGIEGIDQAIQTLYNNGYMHNHCRMYSASLVCNIAHSHWHHPATWMYYHLLDGDWASNFCSWQWVAGANSNKRYYANQENINKYTHTNQSNTFLDNSYENLEQMATPSYLLETTAFNPKTTLPQSDSIKINSNWPTFIYNYYNLDPEWHKDENRNSILLLEPTFFEEYPVSEKCIQFMLALSKNITDIQVYVGSFASFVERYQPSKIVYKEHPLNKGYIGVQESRDWVLEEVTGYHPSFFAYWKKMEKHLYKKYRQ